MSGMKEIFKKELARIFKDRKMMFSVFILPVVIMIGIFSIIGNLISNMEDDINSHQPIVYVQNATESFRSFLTTSGTDYKVSDVDTTEENSNAKHKILVGDADLLIEFPEDFNDAIANYQIGDDIPQIKTYYNPSEDYSKAAHDEIVSGALESYRQALLTGRVGDLEQITVFTVDSDNKDMIIQDDKKANGKALGMMLPYFITILLFAGAMGIGTDMIAGEKERGTMASLLVAPVKRSSIVLGKVFALMAITGISSVIYIAAMGFFMPKALSSAAGGAEVGLKMSLDISQTLMMGILLVAVAFLYSTIIALVSVFAKTVKEASTYIMPVYMAVLVVGMITMYTTGDTENYVYWIPLYNTSMAFKGILSQELTSMQYATTLGITLILGIALTGIIVKAFQSEKVMAQ